jgi:hypothetical protein
VHRPLPHIRSCHKSTSRTNCGTAQSILDFGAVPAGRSGQWPPLSFKLNSIGVQRTFRRTFRFSASKCAVSVHVSLQCPSSKRISILAPIRVIDHEAKKPALTKLGRTGQIQARSVILWFHVTYTSGAFLTFDHQLTMLVNYEKQTTTTYTRYASLPLTARPLDFFYFIFFAASCFPF